MDHLDSCPWSNPEATCGPDTCICTLRKIRESLEDKSDESDKESDIIECFEWRCYPVKIVQFFIEIFNLFKSFKEKFL